MHERWPTQPEHYISKAVLIDSDLQTLKTAGKW